MADDCCACDKEFLCDGWENVKATGMECWQCACCWPACLLPPVSIAVEGGLKGEDHGLNINCLDVLCGCCTKCSFCCPFLCRMCLFSIVQLVTLCPIMLLLTLVFIVPVWGWLIFIGFEIMIFGINVHFAVRGTDCCDDCCAPTNYIYSNFCLLWKNAFCMGAAALIPCFICLGPISVSGATTFIEGDAPRGAELA